MKFKRNLVILSAILIAVLILGTGCFPTAPPVDTDAPKLSTAVYSDANSSSSVNKGDTIAFTFNEEMEKSTITSSNVSSRLPLSAGTYGTGPTVSWNTAGTICTVTLGTSPSIVVGTTTVNPSASVTDTAGNADASSAVTISGLTAITVLSSVSISPSTATGTVGTAMSQSFTASALSTAATTMTSSCTFTWSISPATGRGSLNSTSGTAVTYTLPATGVTAGTATITVTAVKTGTTTPTKTATATITVGTTTPSTPTVDPAKLFVSKQTGKATYTALPAGATSVTVYSHADQDPLAAVTDGVKYTIILSNIPTVATNPITAGDHIYFMISYSDGTTSTVTYDGQLPDKPSTAALAKIQATNKNTVTSTAADNVDATDKITLYISGAQKSNPASVGSTMTFVYDLAAGNQPTYTRTNANGHESEVSGTDGIIVQITGVAYTNNGGAADGKVDPGDVITITYSGNVTITAVPISFSLGGTTITAGLAATGNPSEALLTITGGPYDLSAQATVNFNLANENIVDASAGGGNWAFEHAVGFDWVPGTVF